MLNEFKRCQFCNESVSIGASKCRYCYEWMGDKPKKIKADTNKSMEKISNKKKQIIALVLFSILFTGGLFVIGAKAFRAIIEEPVVKACNFNDLKTADGYIFRLIDDPDKKDEDSYIIRDKTNCKYYISSGEEKIEVTQELAQSLVIELENTSLSNMKPIQFPATSTKKIHASIDVVSDNPQISEKVNKLVDGLTPGSILTLQIYGGNAKNALSQKKININYTNVEFEMYKKTFERQRETVIYVRNKVDKREKLDMDAVVSNDKKFIRHNIDEFYNTFKASSDYNQSRFLYYYLDYLEDNLEVGTEYLFITDGSFSRVDQRYYNFDEKHFNYHQRRIIERLKVIEDMKNSQRESLESEQEEIPEKLPAFYTYFTSRLKDSTSKFEKLCFDLVRSEKERNTDWLNEKNKLFKSIICKK